MGGTFGLAGGRWLTNRGRKGIRRVLAGASVAWYEPEVPERLCYFFFSSLSPILPPAFETRRSCPSCFAGPAGWIHASLASCLASRIWRT